MGTGKVSTGTPTRLRSFDPVRLADLEYRAWVGYYLRQWPQVLRASIGLVRLDCYLYGEPEEAVRPAAVHRAKAMDLSDRWVEEGCPPDSLLLPLEHAALVRAYAA